MPTCNCCGKILSARQIRNHKKYGPPLATQIGQVAKGLPVKQYAPKKPRRKVKKSDGMVLETEKKTLLSLGECMDLIGLQPNAIAAQDEGNELGLNVRAFNSTFRA